MPKEKKKVLIHFTPVVAKALKQRVKAMKDQNPALSASNSRIVDIAISLYLRKRDEEIEADLRDENRIVALASLDRKVSDGNDGPGSHDRPESENQKGRQPKTHRKSG